jgi:hypothetical protein
VPRHAASPNQPSLRGDIYHERWHFCGQKGDRSANVAERSCPVPRRTWPLRPTWLRSPPAIGDAPASPIYEKIVTTGGSVRSDAAALTESLSFPKAFRSPPTDMQ